MQLSALYSDPSREKRHVVVEDSTETVARYVEVADTFLRRLAGLQFRLPLRESHGLLLYPAGGIHTFWMRGAIDVIWLDSDGVVLRIAEAVGPWRMRRAPKDSFAVLELANGIASARSTLVVGARLACAG